MDTRIYLSKPAPITCLESNFLIENNVSNFEEVLEDYFDDTKFVVALSSGTSAIHLALILSGVVAGDEVLCQSFTFVATANPILYQKATPVFIDSELDTWNMCPIYLEKAIKDRISKGKKPKAILVVHLYGMPAKMDEIVSIARKYEIILITDAAESLGSKYKGIKCGSFGDYGVFSFNNNKVITTFGGGALICTKQKEKEKAIFLATQARDKAAHYQHSQKGYNYRLSPVLAGIGSNQMEVLEEKVQLRRKNNQFYQQLFKGIKGITVFREPSKDYYSNHWLSCILINAEITGFTREDLRLQLEKDNIETRPLWKPMHLQPIFKDSIYYGKAIAETLFNCGLCLPSSSNLAIEDKLRIKKSIQKLVGFNR